MSEQAATLPRMGSFKARDVAAELRKRIPDLGIKKLHKLLYYCQGHHLAVYNEPLFDETITAWDMGPVVGSFWHEERNPGLVVLEPINSLPEEALNTIGYVVSRYGALTGADLEHLTHGEAPWRDADSRRKPGGRVTITTSAIADYFRRNVADEDDEADTPMPDDETVTAWLTESYEARRYEGKRDDPARLMDRLNRLAAT
jgi:uncharacterized phage-associated protein